MTVRKQFARKDGSEIPIIDYPVVRYRLMPVLARIFGANYFMQKIVGLFAENIDKIRENATGF